MAVGFTTTKAGDGKHMLIGLSPASTTRSTGCPIVGVMVDGAMKPIWTNTLGTEPGNVRTDVVSTLVDKTGAAWYLIKNVTDAAPKTKDVVGYTYSLYRMDSLGQQGFPLDLGKKDFVQEAAFTILPDGRLACAGIYSNGDVVDHGRNETCLALASTLGEFFGGLGAEFARVDEHTSHTRERGWRRFDLGFSGHQRRIRGCIS